ncbi:hypothetical protein [Bacillus tuaregi]|uniref:hypothetical protein n=1 Tax=Bacillus tuaregi TaxID=1816695 RepID=UPI001114658C|nr:hypothetical protein [Bacillus tuaregi]
MENITMNRLDFLKEMKTGFLKTVNAVYEPILEDDIVKMNQAADQLLGVEWSFLMNEQPMAEGLEQKFVKGQPVIVMHKAKTLYAYSGVCPACSQLLHISMQEKICKCLNCEKHLSIENKEEFDSLILKEYPLKKKKDGYYIALKNRVQDDSYA